MEVLFLVALAELNGTVEDEATHLAKDLGVALYEARLMLSGERPKVLLRSADQARALSLLGQLRARGHGAVACDAKAIVSIDAMVQVEQFRLSDTAMILPGGEELVFTDTLAILRAVRGEHTTQTHTTTERTFAVGRAIASGGLLISKKSTRTDTKTREEREQVLFLFRRAGDAWVVRESCTLFEGLAELMAASVAENLVRLIAELRARAPNATFDDRLTRFHTADAQASSRLDEQAHLLALAIVRLGRGPYR